MPAKFKAKYISAKSVLIIAALLASPALAVAQGTPPNLAPGTALTGPGLPGPSPSAEIGVPGGPGPGISQPSPSGLTTHVPRNPRGLR
jgi:hypothetical protein